LHAFLPGGPAREKEILGSDWVLLTKDRDLTQLPGLGEVARELKSKPGTSLWTDDYSNLVQIVKYKLPLF